MTGNGSPFLISKEQRFSWGQLTFRSAVSQPRGPVSIKFFWARNAIFHGLQALGVQPGERILVPSYVCAAAIEPIEAFGAKPVFYNVCENCTPDWTDLEWKIDSETRGILAVHYFGFPCEVQRFRELCDRRKLFLIEDCAHVLKGAHAGQPLGDSGDFSVFSWRKFLPLFDGGELVLNRPVRSLPCQWSQENPLFTLRVMKNLIEQSVTKPRPSPSHLVTTTEHRKHPGDGSAAKQKVRPKTPLAVDPNDFSYLPWMVNFPMSRMSRLLLPHFSIQVIAAKRRNNYLYLQTKLSLVNGVRLLFQGLPEGVVPWVLPMFLEGLSNAHQSLRALGIPAVTWGGVRHPGISPVEFPGAHFLYENLVFLPIHQDLETRDLDLIVEAVKTVRQTNHTATSVSNCY
jgi:perosamine synthetase